MKGAEIKATGCKLGIDRMRNVAGTLLHAHWIISDQWIDMPAWTGRAQRTLPAALREPGEVIANVASLMAHIGDVHCHPGSGGIAGHSNIAPFFGVDAQQFKRNVAPGLDYLRWLFGIPITNVASAYADGQRYRLSVNEKWVGNLCGYAPDQEIRTART